MKWFFSLTLFGLLLFVGCAKKSSATTEPKFTYTPPSSWIMQKMPGMTNNEIAFGPRANGFSPNINVIAEKYRGSLESYEEANIKGIPSIVNATIQGHSDFTTTKGMKGKRIFYTSTSGMFKMRHFAYLFGNGDYKFVVTCTALESDGEKYDATFDNSIKTFEFTDN